MSVNTNGLINLSILRIHEYIINKILINILTRRGPICHSAYFSAIKVTYRKLSPNSERMNPVTDTIEKAQKWTLVFSSLGRVGKKREENSVFTFGRFRLWTSSESSPVSINVQDAFFKNDPK